jgi:uncharacterized protein
VSSTPDAWAALDPARCLELLGRAGVGRLGVSMDALPAVYPVEFALEGDDSLLVRVGANPRVAAAARGAVVALEADSFDIAIGEAWSVLVRGVCTELGPETRSEHPWAALLPGPMDAGAVLRIRIAILTGWANPLFTLP